MTTLSSDTLSPTKRQPELNNVKLDFPVVGIGASAGGIQATLSFFEHMPSDSGMAFVVIMHLSPDHKSGVDKVLQGVTSMPVQQVTGPLAIEPNHIYVISPALELSMDGGMLRVSDAEPQSGGHVAIDIFFRTLAEVHTDRAFGVLLSGTGSDGSMGLSRIKEQGGVTIAQMPDDAEHDGMPRSAIATGNVDLVLPVAAIPGKLVQLWENARRIRLPHAHPDSDTVARVVVEGEEREQAEQALGDLLDLLFAETGHNFRHYKRATVLRRVERRLQVNTQSDLPAYLAYVKGHPEENQALLADLLIGVTNFFRDREPFEALERNVIPMLFSTSESGLNDPGEIRVWSAGCSSGEEAYSLAMLLCDQARMISSPMRIQVFATDIDERAIAKGRQGIFAESIAADVSPARLHDYFIKEPHRFVAKKEMREKVLFAQHSLLRDPPFSRLQLISCRNLLIYLDRNVQREILQMFHFALRPGGYLFLGNSESADMCAEFFAPVDKKNRIFRAKIGPVFSRPISSLPASVTRRTASPVPYPAAPVRHSVADMHQRALEQYAPPSVIINPDLEIVHMSDRVGHFLRHVGGEPSQNLTALVRPELRPELRTLLFQALQSNQSVEARRVTMQRDGRTYYVNMVARPFRDEPTSSDYVLVLFDEVEDTLGEKGAVSHEAVKEDVLKRLEQELQRTKLQLQDTLEHSRVSTEELEASNEELQAINEELRSATEELETSKEELQSINEELITVNQELKFKVEETDRINDDLQNLISSTDIATVFVDRKMRIKWFTPRATELFSILPVDSGRPLMDITHRLDYVELVADAARVFESLMPVEREVRSADNRHYLARLVPYRTSEDRIEGAVLTFIDITARRAAEQEMLLGEERMRMVADSTADYAIIVQDSEGIITSWNKGAELIFGYTRDEAVGQYSGLIFTPEDCEAGVPADELRRARETGRADDERWHLRKDGSRFYCSGVVNLLQSDDFQGFVKIARNLTDRQQELDAQQLKLAETQNASQLKDEFFAVMSHELKHPLNLIQLNADLLSRLPVAKSKPMVARAVRTIRDAVSSQARIIDDLLDVSRVRTGKLKLHREPMNLSDILRAVASVVNTDPQSAGLTLQVPDEPLIMDADSTRIEQVVWNLVNNALKFTEPDGHIEMRASADGTYARLDVIDDGQGIAAEYLDKVFDLFGQAKTQHARLNSEGMGIGLSLVRQLTEAHDGRVEVRSDGPGKGSHFTVWLPLYDAGSPGRADEDEPLEPAGLQNLRVMLVDDSPAVTEVMQMLLESEGAVVHCFSSPLIALDAADAGTFDLIISDIGMPEMDGYAFMQALRKKPAYATVPTIAMSGYSGSSDVSRALAAGFDRHLGKPVHCDDMIATILQVLPGALPVAAGL